MGTANKLVDCEGGPVVSARFALVAAALGDVRIRDAAELAESLSYLLGQGWMPGFTMFAALVVLVVLVSVVTTV